MELDTGTRNRHQEHLGLLILLLEITEFYNCIAESLIVHHQKFHTESVQIHLQLFGDQEEQGEADQRTQYLTSAFSFSSQ